MNFGATPFKHGPPPGYVGLAAAPPAGVASWQDALSALGVAGAERKPLAIILEPARWVAGGDADLVWQASSGRGQHLRWAHRLFFVARLAHVAPSAKQLPHMRWRSGHRTASTSHASA